MIKLKFSQVAPDGNNTDDTDADAEANMLLSRNEAENANSLRNPDSRNANPDSRNAETIEFQDLRL